MSFNMVSDLLMIQLCSGADLDACDKMRVNLFCMDCEKLASNMDKELPLNLFIDEFCNKIVMTSGYASFAGFCNIDKDGLQDIASKVHSIVC